MATQKVLIVCAAIIVRRQTVLLTLRPEGKPMGGYWEFPGGKPEPGESPHAALHRELREELDITIKIERLLEKVHYTYDWGAVRIDGYLCRHVGGTIKNLEVADHAWVSFDQLDQYRILPADGPFIELLQNFLDKQQDAEQIKEEEL